MYPSKNRHQVSASNRQGSALLIVMVLIAMLSLLGVMFYVFASQERLNAEYYSEASKVQEYDFTVDQQMDFALEQLIVGPKPGQFKNSALYGGRHSIIPNMLGNDLHPYNGAGVPLGDSTVTSADGQLLYHFNDSPVADGNGADRNLSQFPLPDVDYTYPDINNVFLSYDGKDPDGRRVIIPSFHRPQYLPAAMTDPWQNAAVREVMRPHTGHNYVPPAGRRLNVTTQRFDPASALFATDPEQGVWTNEQDPPGSGNYAYSYDVDNDGDGVKEGVWLDIDFPALENEEGQLYVPLVSFTVKEADALLNLNVHGNLARVWSNEVAMQQPFVNSGTPGRQDRYVSSSNLGLSPAEVNPLWGLNRIPVGEGTYAAESFFNTAAPVDHFESANREWQQILMGRFNQATTDLIPGRFGESHLLYSNVNASTSRFAQFFSPWPGPGQTDVDDNGDSQQVSGGWYGQTFTPFGRPLDYSGLGSFSRDGKYPLTAPTTASNPGRWPQYRRYSTMASVQPQWASYTNGMDNSVASALDNDMMETVFDARERRPDDDLFGPDEMRALHLNGNDFLIAAGGESRLTKLAPYNFGTSSSTFSGTGNYESNRSSLQHRSKFTTLSWDRKQFNPPPFDPVNRAWEYRADANRNRRPQGSNMPANTGETGWEFPPSYGITPEQLVYTLPGTTPGDPFRPALRRLLEVEVGTREQSRLQFRWNLNQLLTDTNGNPLPSFDTTVFPPEIPLAYRSLTDHRPEIVDGSSLGGPYVYPSNGSFPSPRAQEYWARRDRQLMARDLYVMLYTFCWPTTRPGGGLNIDPTGKAPSGTYEYPDLTDENGADRRMIRKMAQYAVNIVDSLDRDNIFTRFEFDYDLTDGWNLDDDPYTDDSVGTREVAWGVERLDLTLSEVLLVQASALTNDETRTQWQDDEGETYFSYVELRNPGPQQVDLEDGWRLRVVTRTADMMMMGPPTDSFTRDVQLRQQTVNPGELYTIASIGQPPTADPLDGTHPSVMKVATGMTAPDWDNDPSCWIAPPNGIEPDVEMQLASHSSLWTNSSDSATALVDQGSFGMGLTADTSMHFVLQRLAYPGRPYDATHNPWVSVDAIEPEIRVANFESSAIDMTLAEMKSQERRQPFSHFDEEFAGTAGARIQNSLGGNNANSPAAFNRFQGVFDRDYASVIELFQISTGGGELAAKGLPAEYYFMNPQDATDNTIGATNPAAWEDNPVPLNRWHRLLEFVEVPTRTHQGIPGFANSIDYPRVPGKININMIRHPEVLAALIDDPTVMHLLFSEDYNNNGVLDPAGPGMSPNLPNPPLAEDGITGGGTAGRIDVFETPPLLRTDTYYHMDGTPTGGWAVAADNWWRGLLFARDGRRVTGLSQVPQPDNTRGLYLPGSVNSTPFRSWGRVDTLAGISSVENALLRSWPTDNGPTKAEHRHLFELGTLQDHTNREIDPAVKNRILAKIANNITTRSNVFVVHLSLKYFRAREVNGAVQIQGPLSTTLAADAPEHRGFFVIDRSQAENAWDPYTERFDFRGVIQFRQVLQ